MTISISGKIWQQEGWEDGRLIIENDRISMVDYGPNLPADYVFPDSYICPGLIETQLNGAVGFDFTRDPSSVATVAAALPRWGVTRFLPTFITAPLETYLAAFEVLADLSQASDGAQVLGAHLEGPYLNPKYRGAHDPAFLRSPNLSEIQQLCRRSRGQLKLMTLAPELRGGTETVEYLTRQGVRVAVGHSGANYSQAQVAFQRGASAVTHLFNASTPLHHREPGLIGAALETESVMTNIIADGVHVHPAMVRLAYQLKGPNGVGLVTDAMAGMGMPPGRYDLAGQDVVVDEQAARLADAPETLAGSVLTLNHAICNMSEFCSCPTAKAVQMVTLNPARWLGLDDHLGRLAPDYLADVAVFDTRWETELTLVNGKVVFERE